MIVDRESQEYKFGQTLGDMTREAAEEFGTINEIEELDSCEIADLQDCIYLLLNQQYRKKRGNFSLSIGSGSPNQIG